MKTPNYESIQNIIGEDHDRVLKLELETFKYYYEEAKKNCKTNSSGFSKDIVKEMEDLIAYDEQGEM